MRRFLVGVIAVAALTGGCSQGVTPHQEPPSASPAAQDIRVGESLDPIQHPTTPRRLVFPHAQARVIPISLQGSTLVPPSNPKVLGWWGRKAGASHGTTVLVGHTVHRAAWKLYGKGKLDNLEDVPLGSDVTVSGVHYTVVSNRIISKAKLARQATTVFAQTGRPRLTIVTCEGYQPSTGIYSSNVVLTAVLAG